MAGLPHSSYSNVVNGIEASDIVVRTSTKGTPERMPLYNPGSILIIPPINKPPALPPLAKTLSESPIPLFKTSLTPSLKSLNVFSLLSILPSSYQYLPISPPPLILIMEKTNPLSRSGINVDLNDASILIPYEPYP